MTRAQRLLLLVLAAVALAVALADAALGVCSGASHLAPVALLFLPLLFGRFPGERLLARSARSRPALRRAPGCPPLAPRAVWRPRRLLLAWHLATRPPPVSLLVSP